jgi:hypothetical protein
LADAEIMELQNMLKLFPSDYSHWTSHSMFVPDDIWNHRLKETARTKKEGRQAGRHQVNVANYTMSPSFIFISKVLLHL